MANGQCPSSLPRMIIFSTAFGNILSLDSKICMTFLKVGHQPSGFKIQRQFIYEVNVLSLLSLWLSELSLWRLPLSQRLRKVQ